MKFKDILSYLLIIVFVVLLRTFIVTPIKVNGESMFPTLEDGEIMLLTKYNKNSIERFDIVVVKTKDDKIIKRVIGMPGEDIEYKDDVLYINHEVIEDSFGDGKTDDFVDYCAEDEYFVLGDNRDESMDSRMIGCVDKSQIMGKTNFIIFPFNNWGKVNK